MSELKAAGWFQEFTDDALKQVVSMGVMKQYRAKEAVFVQGEPLTHYFFVVDGLIHAYHQNREGKKWIASLFSCGDLFPHTGLVDDENRYPANGETITPCLLFVIKREKMHELMRSYPSLERRLTQFFAKKSQELMNRYADSVLEPALVQLVSLLKRLVQQSGTKATDGWVLISTMMTEQDMAGYIGVTPETVSRLLNRLYREKRAKSAGRGKIYIDLDKC
ncbi:Crp/Fnr family transcriptional regulator [Sporolactobacillus sp. STCC-11]|uniref:Crp/Fnr family transcriptional regulator n=1 Tax=Sporolactobacillus caesalpiniae TaxID=3230362 RepID=UPI003397788D